MAPLLRLTEYQRFYFFNPLGFVNKNKSCVAQCNVIYRPLTKTLTLARQIQLGPIDVRSRRF